MRDDRYTRDVRDDEVREYDAYRPYNGYGDVNRNPTQVTGFTRHQSSNARRAPSQNPVVGAAKRIGSSIGGVFAGRKGKDAPRSPRGAEKPHPSRQASSNVRDAGGDYLGVGEECRICGNPVDAGQSRCPHCGAFVRPLYQHVAFWIAIVVLIAIVVVLSVVINSCRSTDEDTDTPVVSAVDTTGLEAAVANAQEVLDEQAANRTYTRWSLVCLESALSSANELLEDSSVTAEQVAASIQSLNETISSMVSMIDEYPWPSYEDLTVPVDGRLGHQVAVNGACLSVEQSDDGTMVASIAMSGDTASIVYVEYESTDAELAVGSNYTVYGTVTGNSDGAPIILADSIEAS